MLNQIRVALICAAISVATIRAQQSPIPYSSVVLDNEYVTVAVEPPREPLKNVLAACGSRSGNPFVRVYVPTNGIRPTPRTPRGSSLDSSFAMFYGSFWAYACSGTDKGTFFHVDLKSIPAKSDFGDDAVKLDPAHNEILGESDQARVVLIHFEPGESGPMVDKRARVIIAVTDSRATITLPDGRTEPREVKAGSVSFGDAGRQATANTGTTPLENIVVELKGQGRRKK